MSPLREAGLTALREIRRNLGSAKGIAMSVLFFLGGLIPSALYAVAKQFEVPGTEISPEERQRLVEQFLIEKKGYTPEIAHHFSSVPPQLNDLLHGTLIFAPLLILLIGFDQIAGDIQHRAIRYIAGRSRRETIVIGKALGLWGIVAVLMLILNLTVWLLTLIQGGGSFLQVISWGPRVWLYSVAAAAAWVGLISCISSFFRTPIVALFVAAPVFFALWLTNLVLKLIREDHPARWALPFRYEDLLMSPEPLKVLGGVGAHLGWGIVLVAVTTIVLKQRDI